MDSGSSGLAAVAWSVLRTCSEKVRTGPKGGTHRHHALLGVRIPPLGSFFELNKVFHIKKISCLLLLVF